MPSALPRLPVRTSQALRDLIDRAGPVNVATRALLILGARAAGMDLGPSIEREIYALLACPELDQGIRSALGAPSARPGLGAVTGDSTGAVTAPVWVDDPFGDIGIEV